ncbi:ABC transporter substrate-binding protein [Pyrobaculum ferrireducens]|nr:ABC transporter substrate-binding protein [Pyrobaculum ferrireducens]
MQMGKIVIPIIIVIIVAALVAYLSQQGAQAPKTGPTATSSPTASPPASATTTTQQTSPSPSQTQRVLKIGCLFDLTGGTADVGVPWSYGAKSAIDAINNGELTELKKLGITLQCVERDYGYKIPEAQAAYEYFKQQGVVAIIGWGTGDTLALAPQINKDGIPYFSGSYTLSLVKNPYNFYTMASYHEAAAAGVVFVKQYFEKAGASPKMALLYPNVPYGLEPLPAIREEAKRQGVAICAEEVVELTAVSADEQVARVRDKCGDAVAIWYGGTVSAGSVIIKSAYKLGLSKAIFIYNIWGANEATSKLLGPDITKWVGGRLFRVTSALMIDDVKKLAQSGDREASLMVGYINKIGTVTEPFIRGWHAAYILAKGIEYAVKNGKEPTSENIKWALENMPEVKTSYAAPVKYMAGDHRPTTTVYIYQMNSDGTWQKVTEITLPRGNLADDLARYGVKQ